jgi:glycosyltransferase involved in cell wall biosynthesis
MHGDGTKLDTTLNKQPARVPARVIDITRLIRRAGRVLTGVDRVEMAYVRSLIADETPVFALARTPFGYVLLDRQGLVTMERRLSGVAKFSDPDVLSRLQRKLSVVERKAQTDLRKLSLARCLPHKLPKRLSQHVPHGASYINVGHSNLTSRVLQAAKSALGGTVAVMIHDVIPLDFPQYQRAGTVETFRNKLRRTRAFADVVIYNSADTQARSEAHMRMWGNAPQGIVAHLATDLPQPDPDFTCPQAPYFVCIGTIEPRKNHAFLLDLWEELGVDAPQLHICGGRGWNNEDVFARLDALPADSKVFEHSGMNDGDMAALLNGANGLLFPSLAEGFGLPPIEAACLGVPMVCNPLAVIRETLGDIPVYAEVTDRYLWINTIRELAQATPEGRGTGAYNPITWSDHFKIALRMF